MPVPLRVEEIVEVRPLVPQESTQQRTEEQIVDVPVRHVVEKIPEALRGDKQSSSAESESSLSPSKAVFGCRGRGSLSLFTSPWFAWILQVSCVVATRTLKEGQEGARTSSANLP